MPPFFVTENVPCLNTGRGTIFRKIPEAQDKQVIVIGNFPVVLIYFHQFSCSFPVLIFHFNKIIARG